MKFPKINSVSNVYVRDKVGIQKYSFICEEWEKQEAMLTLSGRGRWLVAKRGEVSKKLIYSVTCKG